MCYYFEIEATYIYLYDTQGLPHSVHTIPAYSVYANMVTVLMRLGIDFQFGLRVRSPGDDARRPNADLKVLGARAQHAQALISGGKLPNTRNIVLSEFLFHYNY